MIVRTWKGRVKPGKGREYVTFLEKEIFPQISALPGSLGARVLRRVEGSGEEYLVMSEWRDLESVRAFADDDLGVAVVEPEAQALLAEYDGRVAHYEVVLQAE
ncbi:MAG: antibiotic biosynthesis monooxygenase [Longimicrobiales bacterium]|nr:antibiotic biosynthesis monooxygenase [Longimicrobiales bacterium]